MYLNLFSGKFVELSPDELMGEMTSYILIHTSRPDTRGSDLVSGKLFILCLWYLFTMSAALQ